MASLSRCIKKAGKSLSAQDAQAIRDRVSEMGGDPVAAVQDYLAELKDQRAELVSDIKGKAPRTFKQVQAEQKAEPETPPKPKPEPTKKATDEDLTHLFSNPAAAPDYQTFTNSQLNREYAKWEKRHSALTGELIRKNRSNDRPSDLRKKSDRLSVEYTVASDRLAALRTEAELRNGPGTYFPLGRGGARQRRADTLTPAFRKWFGNSKVVDENGDPLRVYHGGYSEIDAFEGTAFFSDSAVVANSYSVGIPGAVSTPVYLSIKNPLVVDYAGREWFGNERVIQQAKDSGHDGAILKNVIDPGNFRAEGAAETQSTVYVTFDPNQVKSAIGNNGEFDPTDTDIRKRLDEKSNPSPLSLDQAEEALAPIRREFDKVNLTVVQSRDDLPDVPATELLRNDPLAKALYDADTGKVYVVSNAHTTPEDVVKSALHEIVAHHGLRQLLGKDMDPLLGEVYLKAKDRERMNHILKLYELDPKNAEDRFIAAEEYLAHMAETHENPSLYNRVVALVRNFLRKLGVVKAYSDNDLYDLLTKTRKAAREAPRQENAVTFRLRKGDADDASIDGDPNSGKSRYNKLSAVMTAMPDSAQNYVEDLPARFESLKDKGIVSLLKAIPRMYLPDFAKQIPAVARYVNEAQRMEATKAQLVEQFQPVVSRLEKLSRADRTALANVQNQATIEGVDPAEQPNPPQFAPRTYMAKYDSLRKMFDKLSPEAQSVYREMRDAHKDMYTMMSQAIEERLQTLEDQQSQTPGKKVSGLDTTRIRKLLESHQLPDPYFPLYRFGDIWVSGIKNAGQKNAERIFSRFESTDAALRFKQDLVDDGYTDIKDGLVSKDSGAAIDAIDPTLFSNLRNAISKVSDDAERNRLQDQIHQFFLMSLPEVSMRKHMIHRKNRAGYSADILRGFARSMFHGSHQLARMQHMTQMQLQLDEAQAEATAQGGFSTSRLAHYVVQELRSRHDWAMNPRSGPLATTLNRLGFTWYLGATPAAALINLSQTPMVALPIVAARFGYKNSTKAFMDAMQEQNTMIGADLGKRFRSKSVFLDQEEKFSYPLLLQSKIRESKSQAETLRLSLELEAYLSLESDGVIDKTQAHDLSGIAELGDRYSGFNHAWTEKISAMFHNAEVWNREVTGMAAYRLARDAALKAGKNTQDAHREGVQQAKELVYLSHFDYTNANRPTYLQNDVAKVMFLFKQHSLNMTYRLGRDFYSAYQSLKKANASDESLKEARRRFVGLLGMTGVFAGVSGLPAFSVIAFVINSIFDDKDDPFDFESEFRASLADAFGEKTATAIMTGPVNALSGIDVASRVGLNNLWIRDPMTDMEADELYAHYTGELLGPMWKIPQEGLRGAELVSKGYDRGFESFLPKAMKDVFKSVRYMREGVNNYRGDEIIPKEDIGTNELIYQLFGFSPEKVTTHFEQNRAIKNQEQHILDRRANLLTRYALASRYRDKDMMREATQDIRDFNKANPRYPLTSDNIRSSMKQRRRFTQESEHGVNINKHLRYLADQLSFTGK